MRRFSLLAAVLLLATCTDTDSPAPLAPDGATLRAHARVAEEVPIHWSYRVGPVGGETIQCTTPEGDPTPVEIGTSWRFEGHLSYIERLEPSESWAVFDECFATFAGETLTALSAPVRVHLEGPDGDALDLEGALEYDLVTTGVGTAELTILGGEGTFAGAEGSLSAREYPLQSIGEGEEGAIGIGEGLVTRPNKIEGRPMKLDFTFEPDYSDGTCDVALPDGSTIPLPYRLNGTGQASHMGRSRTTITHEWCRMDPARGIVSGGTFETVGANGDAVNGVWDGYTDLDHRFSLVGWLTDGTGRFTGSWGELDIRGESDPVVGGWFDADGRIVY